MSGRVFIHATNVHQGGGRALLGALFGALRGTAGLVLVLDERMPIPEGGDETTETKRVKSLVMSRLGAELWLAQSVADEDIVLCFGNLPPLFRLRGRTVVFVQNRYLIDDVGLSGFPFRVRLRLAIERLWLSARISNASEFIVQTDTMKRMLTLKVRNGVPVRVLPFVAKPDGYARNVAQFKVEGMNVYDFAYVASGEPHKNHRRLMEAWRLLAEEGHYPSLCLTVDEAKFPGLCGEIDAMRKKHGLLVTNVGTLPHQEVLALYKKSCAAIYPSTFESFGLPLIEARQANLPVLASEMDYVRDVLDPEQTFDPASAISIARAVKRFIGAAEEPLPLLGAEQFIAAVLGKAD